MIPPQDGQKTGQSIVGDASHVRSTPSAAHNQLGQDRMKFARTVVNLRILDGGLWTEDFGLRTLD